MAKGFIFGIATVSTSFVLAFGVLAMGAALISI